MNVKIKGINDFLCFELNQEVLFTTLYKDLKGNLDAFPHIQHGYYPKAFFDFKGRKISEKEMLCLIELLYASKKVLYAGIKQENIKRQVTLVERNIYNGETLEIDDQDLVIIGHIHKGAKVISNRNIYVVGCVEGTIEALSKEAMISLSDAKNAQISIFNKHWQDVTIFTLTVFYYERDR